MLSIIIHPLYSPQVTSDQSTCRIPTLKFRIILFSLLCCGVGITYMALALRFNVAHCSSAITSHAIGPFQKSHQPSSMSCSPVLVEIPDTVLERTPESPVARQMSTSWLGGGHTHPVTGAPGNIHWNSTAWDELSAASLYDMSKAIVCQKPCVLTHR